MFSGRKAMPETMNKSSFAQTCNRLSQFLKARRSLGDFASFQNMSSSMLDINGAKEMAGGATNKTMNLFPKKMEEDKNVSTGEENIKSLDLFPLTSSSATASTTDESTKTMADWSESPISKEALTTTGAKMTIFYGGQVLVFDDLPEDKAEEIMSLASQLGTMGSHSEPQTQVQAQTLNLPNNIVMAQPTQGSSSILQQPASLSDLPIARRVSLHRFMEKRKDRIAGASPYQVQRNMGPSLSEKYDLMRQLRQKQHQQQELELKLF
ncbi:hypothetical protein Cgig2_025195 [Carnegiea gigantea]|uniref:Protein TIFY n=1 Tax=Carnegiea gigantea TaxID=171969 RepID=A0A9Q1KPB5_9CARY|nr:hypothetical protein Cgig2_025195 [Carnegiea gigantea]